MKKTYTVLCAWDPEAGVWYVSKSNVPGLATESATVEAMTRKLRSLIPELLSLNEGGTAVDVPVELLWRKQELISIKRG
jgi:predicted RNase H-like HicB family nuclease